MCYITHIKTKEDIREDPYLFCPITKNECNKHCMWSIRNETIDEDGVEVFHQCAVLGIFDILSEMNGAHEEEAEF